MIEKFLIVGLGNPGEKYENTRHNVGFLVVKNLAEKQGLKFSASSLTKGYTAEFDLGPKKITLLLPTTYMNDSGVAVKALVSQDNLDLDKVLVITDDVNLDFGQLRIRAKGSDGGHNGLKSIIERLAAEDFVRLRVGVGGVKSSKEMSDYVLEPFSKAEQKELGCLVEEASDCCMSWLNEGINQAMNQFNRRKEDG